MSEILENLNRLGPRRLFILGGTLVGMLMALLVGLSVVNKPDYTALLRELPSSAATSVAASLSEAGFDVQVSDDSTSILVPRDDLARARMVLAETGIPIDGDLGWELFDEASGVVMNSFMQRVNRLRAMEGELARSIQTLDGIQSARVHLVLPEREAFSREKSDPRASIVIRPVPGRAVSRKHALAVRNLVASSVADLELGRVTVLSANGEVILAENTDGASQVTLQSTRSAIEEQLSNEVQSILSARVGAGNSRVRVNVELSNAREVIVEHSYDPDQQVVRSTESRLEERAGTENSTNVGVENNIPAALADQAGGVSSSQSRSGEIINYEIGNSRRETVREAGEIIRISVAVLVNGIYSIDGSDVTYTDRDPGEIERLEELVKTAVGFKESRGDEVSVDSLRFFDYSMEVGEPIGQSITQRLSQNAVSLVRGLLALGIVALIMIFGLRPALRVISESGPVALPDAEEVGEIQAPNATESSGQEVLTQGATSADPIGDNAMGAATVYRPEEDSEPQKYIEALGVRGGLLKARVEAIQDVASDQPDEVLRVMRLWMSSEVNA